MIAAQAAIVVGIACIVAFAPILAALFDDEARRRERRRYAAETGCAAP